MEDVMLTHEAGHEIILSLREVNQLFEAPAVDPFSFSEAEVLGDSGLARIMQLMLAWRARTRDVSQLTLLLPSSEIEPGTATAVADALQRYGRAKIADNGLQIRSIIMQALTQLSIIIMVMSLLILAVVVLIQRGVISTTSFVGLMIGVSLCVLFWVAVWFPVESLAFDWIPAYRENRVLARIMAMKVVVKPLDDATAGNAARPERKGTEG